MKTTKLEAAIAVAAAFAIVTLCAGAPARDTASAWLFGTAYAQSHSGGPSGSSGGHDSSSTGGHDSSSTGGHDSSSTGGHDSSSTGGHDSSSSGGSGGHAGGPGGSGGHSGGAGGSGTHAGGSGGHDSGSTHGGYEAKGHGTRYQHRGHAGGTHGAASAHAAGANRFGGGSGVRGNSQVPEGIGRYGGGTEYASDSMRTAARFRFHFRYWGGWTLPDDPADSSETDPTSTAYLTSTTDVVPGGGGGPSINVRNVLDSPLRCEGVSPNMPAAEQLSRMNLGRLTAAQGVVDPAIAATGEIPSPYLMANLQGELAKASPDPQLAGTYLGLVSKVPVTPEKLEQVSFYLCVQVGKAQVQQICQFAEEQRRALMASANSRK